MARKQVIHRPDLGFSITVISNTQIKSGTVGVACNPVDFAEVCELFEPLPEETTEEKTGIN